METWRWRTMHDGTGADGGPQRCLNSPARTRRPPPRVPRRRGWGLLDGSAMARGDHSRPRGTDGGERRADPAGPLDDRDGRKRQRRAGGGERVTEAAAARKMENDFGAKGAPRNDTRRLAQGARPMRICLLSHV